MNVERILAQLVRVGIVSDTDREKRMARVIYRDTGQSSGWLYVLASRPYIPDYDASPQSTEPKSGGSEYGEFDEHRHDLTVKPWMPRVNATVLTLYLPMDNANGFILGEIGPLDRIKQ